VRRFVENKLEVEGGRGHVEPPTAGVPCAHCMWKKQTGGRRCAQGCRRMESTGYQIGYQIAESYIYIYIYIDTHVLIYTLGVE
jgi:hypothetical protein